MVSQLPPCFCSPFICSTLCIVLGAMQNYYWGQIKFQCEVSPYFNAPRAPLASQRPKSVTKINLLFYGNIFKKIHCKVNSHVIWFYSVIYPRKLTVKSLFTFIITKLKCSTIISVHITMSVSKHL